MYIANSQNPYENKIYMCIIIIFVGIDFQSPVSHFYNIIYYIHNVYIIRITLEILYTERFIRCIGIICCMGHGYLLAFVA